MNDPQEDNLGEQTPAPSTPPAYVDAKPPLDASPDSGSLEPQTIATTGAAGAPPFEATLATAAMPPAPGAEPGLFQSYTQPPPRRVVRIPNFGHLCLLIPFALVGLVCTIAVLFVASKFHLLGIDILSGAATRSGMDARVIVVSEGCFYISTFVVSLIVFPLIWNQDYFTGIHWRGSVVLERFWRLAATAVGCFVLALIDGVLLPGPPNAPIEKIFKTPGSAWMMFGFGITMAPFFEEMFFRGFLLPSLCTAWDWIAEKLAHRPMLPLDSNGHPQWSVGAMVFGAVVTSLPFAGIHMEQQGNSLGPFLLLVVVSLVLCTVRLWNRSLASSTVVHACYNFCIFTVTFVQTSGFKHLEKM
jgi:uncharacterized protein